MPAPRIPRTIARRKSKPGLRKRVQHLAFVRQLPCVAWRQSSAFRCRACADRNRWRCRGETGRSLCRSAVRRLPRKAASDRRTDLLVSTPHRSSQRGFAAVVCIGRYGGRGAHGVSRATANRPGEGIWLSSAYLTSRLILASPTELGSPQDRSAWVCCCGASANCGTGYGFRGQSLANPG